MTGNEVGCGFMGDEPSSANDNKVFSHQCHLRELMTADENCSPLTREILQHVAHPPDAFRVETVCWLIEDDDLGVTEHRRSESEALLHTE